MYEPEKDEGAVTDKQQQLDHMLIKSPKTYFKLPFFRQENMVRASQPPECFEQVSCGI